MRRLLSLVMYPVRLLLDLRRPVRPNLAPLKFPACIVECDPTFFKPVALVQLVHRTILAEI